MDDLEDKTIDKMIKRLDKIRKKMEVTYGYTTYDTNIVLEEVGHELRMIQIGKEKFNRVITPKQLSAINKMRAKAGEESVEANKFKTSDEVSEEFDRLKEKLNQ